MLERSRSSIITAVLLFVASVASRILPPGSFVTVDEAYHWFDRAELFLQALEKGDYAATNLVGHPGVTTMWLGAFGLKVHRILIEHHLVQAHNLGLDYFFLRLPVALATSICLLIAFFLLRRLFNPQVALASAILWAGEPMLVAHSQLLHVDALLSSFMALSILVALLAWHISAEEPGGPPSLRLIAASAVAGGLALVTKSPALMLGPMLGLIGLASIWQNQAGWQWKTLWRYLILPLMLWGALVVAVWILMWPAAWVSLPTAIESVYLQVKGDGGSPHAWGNFFWGQTVDDPGIWFYPVATAFRLTARAMIGCIIALILFFARPATRGRIAILLLFSFVIAFTLFMSIPPKKFDRYVLPIFPALVCIAGWGFGEVMRLYRHQWQRTLHWATLLFFAIGTQISLYPYTISFYNPLLGGGEMAAKIIPVGWGEGYEQVGAFISAQPDGDRPVATWYGPVLKPFVRAGVTSMIDSLEPGQAGYAVLYIDQIQRRDSPQSIDALMKRTPVHTIWINDIPYAQIYQLPRPVAHTIDAAFGSVARLHGYDTNTSLVRSSGILTFTMVWDTISTSQKDAMLFIHVLDDTGKRVAQIDVPPAGPERPVSSWKPGWYQTSEQRVLLPADLPAGHYWIAIGLYDPTSGQRTSLYNPSPPTGPSDGDHALTLDGFTLQ